ncbi:MAG: mannose-1-phosphate guanylyltransferase, partial [Marinibacterium sp.]
MTRVHPVILTGGSGTRLWPASRKAYPKQFAPLLGKNSLYQETLSRFSGPGFGAPLIMTGEDFRFMAVEQARAAGLMDARVVVEPVARDTAPAILAAALMLEETPEALMLVAPSDHVIGDAPAFLAAVAQGADAAGGGALVTFGIMPDRAETGYGYLELDPGATGLSEVRKFREKPDAETAEAMLAAGHYLWNAGLFLGRVGDFIAAFEAHAPGLMAPVRAAVAGAARDLDFTRLAADPFGEAQAISVDYAIMEKTHPVLAVPMDCGWSDLGAWDALWDIAGKDDDGNVTSGDVTALDSTGSYLRSDEDGPHLVGLGLTDMVAV